ncbi:MAG: hypothetical protein ACP5HZ_10360 [Ferrimicrobium sp.]
MMVLAALDGSEHGDLAGPTVGATASAFELLPRDFVWPSRSVTAARFGLGVAPESPQEEM